jgi:uncharacterized protein (TIGR02270 family)
MITDLILWDVVEEHLDEAEFLLGQWLKATSSPRLSLEKIHNTVEPRLIAHLDGLFIGGPAVAERLLWPLLESDGDSSEKQVSAAALALLVEAERPMQERLLGILREASSPAVRAGIARAFQLCPLHSADEALRLALYASDSAAAQAALLDVLAARRVDPGPILASLLDSDDPGVARAALGAAAVAERATHRQRVEEHLFYGGDDVGIRAAALQTGLIWNVRTIWEECLVQAQAGLPGAMLLVGLVGGKSDLAMLIEALARPERRADALWALGFTGRVEAVDACLALIADEDPRVAKLALEAVASITGLPFEEPPFALPPPAEEADLPPLEEDLTRDLKPTPLDELPGVDRGAVVDWWAERRPAFASNERFLQGQAFSSAVLTAALTKGPARRHRNLALELSIRSGGQFRAPEPRLGLVRPDPVGEMRWTHPPRWN